jgi:hypothetical protein
MTQRFSFELPFNLPSLPPFSFFQICFSLSSDSSYDSLSLLFSSFLSLASPALQSLPYSSIPSSSAFFLPSSYLSYGYLFLLLLLFLIRLRQLLGGFPIFLCTVGSSPSSLFFLLPLFPFLYLSFCFSNLFLSSSSSHPFYSFLFGCLS